MRSSKIAVVLLLAVLLLSGCSGTQNSGTQDYESDLKDGEYTVYSKYYDPWGYGLTFRMKVVSGIVTSVHMTEANTSGADRLTLSDADKTWDDGDQKLSAVLGGFYDTLIHRQSADIDAVSGATTTSDSFKLLAEAAFDNAKTGKTSDVINDFEWTYTVTNDVDAVSGSQETLSITFTGDKMTAVECSEVVNSTALYATGRIYAGFAETTMQSQTLTAITSIQDPSEAERYNAMLDQISQLRQQYN